MVCPKCGSEIQEDMLYCEICGEEIQYVPEFEPVIEQSISNTLSKIEEEYADGEYPEEYAEEEYADGEYPEEYAEGEYAEEYVEGEYIEEYEEGYEEGEYLEDGYIGEYDDGEYLDEFDEEYDGDDYDDEDEENDIPPLVRIRSFFRKPKNIVLLSVLFVCLVVAVVFGIKYVREFSRSMVEDHSYSHQATLARQAALNGDYEEAISYMEKALALNSTDSSMKYDLAQYYLKNKESEKAILILWEIIYGKEKGYENAYALMLDFYVGNGDFAMVKEILDHCDSNVVLRKYKNYLANVPEFSDPEGTYENVVCLKLSSASTGTIYYTLDGTPATEESTVYVEPIIMDLGRYEVNALFVNSYGIHSDPVRKQYIIDIRVPDAPVVLLEDGEYETPEIIEVEAQKFCTVHYTTDGTTPTMESAEYTGPLAMPLGFSHFIFASYSQEGVRGGISEAEYNLILDSGIQIEDILTNICYYNLNMGKTRTLEGLMMNGSSSYTYTVSTAIAYDDDVYYIFIEYLMDTNYVSMKTGTIYLANTETGELYKSVKDPETELPKPSGMIESELYQPIGETLSQNTVLVP